MHFAIEITLRQFLGEFIYWPLVAILIGFALVSFFSNISMIYTEVWHQLKELRRLRNGDD